MHSDVGIIARIVLLWLVESHLIFHFWLAYLSLFAYIFVPTFQFCTIIDIQSISQRVCFSRTRFTLYNKLISWHVKYTLILPVSRGLHYSLKEEEGVASDHVAKIGIRACTLAINEAINKTRHYTAKHLILRTVRSKHLVKHETGSLNSNESSINMNLGIFLLWNGTNTKS